MHRSISRQTTTAYGFKGAKQGFARFPEQAGFAVIYDGDIHFQAKDKPMDGIRLFVNVVPLKLFMSKLCM